MKQMVEEQVSIVKDAEKYKTLINSLIVKQNRTAQVLYNEHRDIFSRINEID